MPSREIDSFLQKSKKQKKLESLATPDGNPMPRTGEEEVTPCSTLVSGGMVKTMAYINRPVSKKVLSLAASSYDTSLTNYLNYLYTL